MGVLSTVWQFLKKHKRKFLFTGTAITGTYFALKYARNKLDAYQEQQMAAAFATAQRQTHFDSNQRTCLLTINSLVPTLRDQIMTQLNCEHLTQQLQTKPSNKVHIWSELKLMAFTRTFASIYSTCILVLTLRVQLNIVGGCIYSRHENENDSQLTEEECAVQQQYLEAIRYFMENGVLKLCDLIQHSVEKEVLNISLKQSLTKQSLKMLIDRIRTNIEKLPNDVKKTPFLAFICESTPFVHHGSHQSSESINGRMLFSLSNLMQETYDIISSEDYHYVLQSMINHGFDYLLTHISRVFASATPRIPASLETRASSENMALPSLPLAKLIPPFVGSVHNVCSDTTTEYLQQLISLAVANDYAFEIYKSFCCSSNAVNTITMS